MTQQVLSHHCWGVECVHCKQFILLHAEEIHEDRGIPVPAHTELPEPGVFLARCAHCQAESPFMTGEIVHQEGEEPPKGFRSHPVFNRPRKSRAHKAGA